MADARAFLVVLILVASTLLLSVARSAAQTTVPPPSRPAVTPPQQAPPQPPPGTIPPELPYTPDLDRIRRGVSNDSGFNWSLEHLAPPMFRVDIEEQFAKRLQEWLGDPKKLTSPPVSTPYYHSEFMQMVTPKDVAALYSNGDVAQLAATSIAGGLIMKALRDSIRSVLNSGHEREACREVAGTLRGLNVERAKAGLPPVVVPSC